MNSVAESYAIARSNLTPLIARLSNGTVVSSMEHGVIPEHIMEQGAELFIDDYSPRIMFLKRLLVCYALCGVYYSEAGNAEQLGDPWPYPIAAILGHGSRVLIRLEERLERLRDRARWAGRGALGVPAGDPKEVPRV